MNGNAITVTQLNTYIRMLFEADVKLKRICVCGELSNFTVHYKSGHCYFSLKDESSAVKAVMFAKSARYLKFRPEDGIKVYVTGRVSVFDRDGTYQIYVESMEPVGSGAMMLAFEQLKEKLQKEGLFDVSRKKAIPRFPKKIAVITSEIGAALQDVINIISRRYPLAELIVVPASVQGVNCVPENIKAIAAVNKKNDIDVIIFGRGGGSAEDLWGYNDEQLVRAVAGSKIPVISGIGHETDITLCDFASDLRAPTPSAAAELAVPDIEELYNATENLKSRTNAAIEKYIEDRDLYLDFLNSKLRLLDPELSIKKKISELELLNNKIKYVVDKTINTKQSELTAISTKLSLLNPLEMLQKGFVPVYGENNKRIISASELQKDDELILTFADGNVSCTVNGINNRK